MTTPAEVFCLANFLCDEMEERGWTTVDVALRMAQATGREYGIEKLIIDMALAVQEDGLLYDDTTIAGLAAAFGVSPQFFRNLDAVWRAHPDRRVPFTAPEEIFGPDQ